MEYPDMIIESLLQKYKPSLGPDYEKYRNHVYRVFLNCLLIDNETNNKMKYSITAVFHDIGIWTNNTFDYLHPSIRQAEVYLHEINKREWIEEITGMIYWHHKITRYKGNHELTVETFRKADWIDVSLGLRTFGYDKLAIGKIRKKLPNRGFHWFLIKEAFNNSLKHPLNPIPVFKK